MRIVYMGTPELSASVLERVADEHEVVGVYTRADAVRGRGKKLVASPVKQAAVKRGIPVFTPEDLRDEAVLDELRSLEPDVICVTAYGRILPRAVLDVPRFGCLNVHTSLLPRWRGAAPMQRAILAGDSETGVCVMKMEEGLDTGAYCERVVVSLDEKYLNDLQSELAREGARALTCALAKLESGGLYWIEQDAQNASYAEKIGKGELWMRPFEKSSVACAKVRASDGAHPARAVLAGRGVTIERAHVAYDEQAISVCNALGEGDLVFVAKRLFAMCSDGPIEIEQVKPDGKKSMPAKDFAGGIQGIKGSTLRWESC